jgi:hypothetical protein
MQAGFCLEHIIKSTLDLLELYCCSLIGLKKEVNLMAASLLSYQVIPCQNLPSNAV